MSGLTGGPIQETFCLLECPGTLSSRVPLVLSCLQPHPVALAVCGKYVLSQATPSLLLPWLRPTLFLSPACCPWRAGEGTHAKMWLFYLRRMVGVGVLGLFPKVRSTISQIRDHSQWTRPTVHPASASCVQPPWRRFRWSYCMTHVTSSFPCPKFVTFISVIHCQFRGASIIFNTHLPKHLEHFMTFLCRMALWLPSLCIREPTA